MGVCGWYTVVGIVGNNMYLVCTSVAVTAMTTTEQFRSNLDAIVTQFWKIFVKKYCPHVRLAITAVYVCYTQAKVRTQHS